MPEDLAAKIPMLKARKQTAIPSVWTHKELTQLISAIDRGLPKGRRDYAMILIACRLGLRCTDIKKPLFRKFQLGKEKAPFYPVEDRAADGGTAYP